MMPSTLNPQPYDLHQGREYGEQADPHYLRS
jgi:hypothetical protein